MPSVQPSSAMFSVPPVTTGWPPLALLGSAGLNRKEAMSAVCAAAVPSHVNTRHTSHTTSVSLRCSMTHASRAPFFTVSFVQLIEQVRPCTNTGETLRSSQAGS